MRSHITRAAGFLICSFLTATFSHAANEAPPSWVQEVATRTLPSYPGRVPVAVLLDEQRETVDPTGRMVITYRRAIKILNQEGRKEAFAAVPYFAGGGKVKDLRAWVVAPGGFTKT